MINNSFRFEGKDKQGKKVVIDVADLNSFDGLHHAMPYELIVMRPRGKDVLFCDRYASVEDAAKAYDKALTEYTNCNRRETA